MNAVLWRSVALPAPWRAGVPTWHLPRIERWQLAIALWAIPVMALWLQSTLVPESLPLLKSWVSADPMLGPAALLIVATELMSILVIGYQLGSRQLSIVRFLLPPLLLACLPMALWVGQIQDQRLFVSEGVPLMSRHVFTLASLLYAGFALLSLRGLLISDPQTSADVAEDAEALEMVESATAAAA